MGQHSEHAGAPALAAYTWHRAAHPRGRTGQPQCEGGNPDHGRDRHRLRGGDRVCGRTYRHPDPVLADGISGGHGGRALRDHRLSRRLDQGPPQTEPRLEQAGEIRGPGRLRRALRRAGPPLGPHLHRAVVHPLQRPGHQPGSGGVGGLRRRDHGGHVERREHHRRGGRPGCRRLHVLFRRAGDHGLLDLPPREHLSRAPGVGDRPGPRRRGAGRGLYRLPLVERGARQDNYWATPVRFPSVRGWLPCASC